MGNYTKPVSSPTYSSKPTTASRPVTVTYKQRGSFYGDMKERTQTFKSEYDYKVWRNHNALQGGYRADGQDARWAARDIKVIG